MSEQKPYDVGKPFDADELMNGFTEERHEITAEDDPVLREMAEGARQAWDAFLAEHGEPDGD